MNSEKSVKRGIGGTIVNSLWLIPTFFIFFNWVPFIVIGIRSKNRNWTNSGIIYSLFVLALFVFSDKDSDTYNILILAYLLSWLTSIIHAVLIRGRYLADINIVYQATYSVDNGHYINKNHGSYEWKDTKTENKKSTDYQSAYLNTTESHNSCSTDEANSRYEFSTGASEQPNDISNQIEAGLVDINNCSEEEMAQLPGVGTILAKKAIEVRKEKGGFSSKQEFFDALLLKPHIIERLADRIIVNSASEKKEKLNKTRVVDF